MIVALGSVLIISSLLMILLVLLHKGKGGGLSDMFGGGASSSRRRFGGRRAQPRPAHDRHRSGLVRLHRRRSGSDPQELATRRGDGTDGQCGGNAIRGSRVGAGPMGEAERGESAPRHRVSFWCANGHETRPSLRHRGGHPRHTGTAPVRLPRRRGQGRTRRRRRATSRTRPTSPTSASGAPTPTATRSSPRRWPSSAATTPDRPYVLRGWRSGPALAAAVTPPPSSSEHQRPPRAAGGRRRHLQRPGVVVEGEPHRAAPCPRRPRPATPPRRADAPASSG